MTRTVLLMLLLTALVSTAAAQSVSPQTPGESNRGDAYYHFSMARMLDQEGQWNQAIDEYKKALELDPDNSSIHSEMAATYYRHRQRSEAVETAQKAVEADRDNIDAHRLLSEIYTAMLGDSTRVPVTADTLDKAVHEFEEILRIDPTDQRAYIMLGRLYQVDSDIGKAIDIYRRYLGIEPASEEGVTTLAKLLVESGGSQEAAALLEEFLQNSSGSGAVYQVLGQAYSVQQEFAKAAEAYGKAIEFDPDDIELKKFQAQALFFDDQLAEAARLYEELLEAEPGDGIALLRLGQIHRRWMQYETAREHLQRAIQLFPNSMEVKFNLVLLERDEGRLDEAVKYAAEVLRSTEKPGGRYTEGERQSRRIFLTQLGLLNSTLGNYDGAIDAFVQLRLIASDKPDIDAAIVETYRTAKDLDKAMEYLQDAMAEFPGNWQLQLLYGDLIAERGRTEEAIELLEELIQGDDDKDLDVVTTIVEVYKRAGDYGGAQGVIDRAMQRFSDNYRLHFSQGALFERQKRQDDAEDAFRRALALDQDNPAILNYLGYMLADAGIKLDEALAMTERAVAAEPTNGHFLDSLGWVYFRLNRLEEAEYYLTRALIFAYTDGDIHDHIGDLYYKTRRYEEARAAWMKSIELGDDPDSIEQVRQKLEGLSRLANR